MNINNESYNDITNKNINKEVQEWFVEKSIYRLSSVWERTIAIGTVISLVYAMFVCKQYMTAIETAYNFFASNNFNMLDGDTHENTEQNSQIHPIKNIVGKEKDLNLGIVTKSVVEAEKNAKETNIKDQIMKKYKEPSNTDESYMTIEPNDILR